MSLNSIVASKWSWQVDSHAMITPDHPDLGHLSLRSPTLNKSALDPPSTLHTHSHTPPTALEYFWRVGVVGRNGVKVVCVCVCVLGHYEQAAVGINYTTEITIVRTQAHLWPAVRNTARLKQTNTHARWGVCALCTHDTCFEINNRTSLVPNKCCSVSRDSLFVSKRVCYATVEGYIWEFDDEGHRIENKVKEQLALGT